MKKKNDPSLSLYHLVCVTASRRAKEPIRVERCDSQPIELERCHPGSLRRGKLSQLTPLGKDWLLLDTHKMTLDDLAFAEWQFDASPDAEPRYVQLAKTVRDAVDRGTIPDKSLLPPERSLADRLSISRTTVANAYNTLRDWRYAERRQGAGTWIRSPHRLELPGRSTTRHRQSPLTSNYIDLTMAAPIAPPDLSEVLEEVSTTWRDVAARYGHGYNPEGLLELRSSIAQTFENIGVPTSENQILITTGAQQAISLISSLLVQPGQTVVVESPTYFGALDVFRRSGAELRPVGLTDEYHSTAEEFESVVDEGPRLVYLVPTFQHPTGTVMPDSIRRAIVEAARRTKAIVVDDRALADLRLVEGTSPPPLAAYDESEDTVLSVGTMSKVFWAGLRVGWIRGSESIIKDLAAQKAVADLGTPVLDQLVSNSLLAGLEGFVKTRRDQLVERLDALTSSLRVNLPSWSWRQPEGGVSLWVQIPEGSASDYVPFAHREGVGLIPGSYFTADEQHSEQALRLPLALDEQDLDVAVQRLARAWDAYGGHLHKRKEVNQFVV